MRRLSLLLLLSLVLLAGCKREDSASAEVMYVAHPEVQLRDRVAAAYNNVGAVRSGDKLVIIGRDRRFVKVRTQNGLEGWIHLRYLVGKEIFDRFEQLRAENEKAAALGVALSPNPLNMHVAPGRETETLYRLNENERVELLKRDVAERVRPGQEQKIPEDWWLVRSKTGLVGWVLGRALDLDVPLEVAQYSEGQRIVLFFVLNKVPDEVRGEGGEVVQKEVPQYLLLYSDGEGKPYAYNQARVFTWNSKRDRYETAYRERNIFGVLPVNVGVEEFEGEGRLPYFVLRVKDEPGNTLERKYKMNGVMVRRVLAPGEEPAKLARPAGKSSRKRR